MIYTRKEIENAVLIKDMLYQRDIINYTGCCKEGQLYSEIIAETVNKYIDDASKNILAIPSIYLRTNFNFSSHIGKTNSNSEETFCRSLYTLQTPFGKAIDYQINLIPGTRVNIDLMTYDEREDIATIVEVKGHRKSNGEIIESAETLLRCILEIESYYRMLIKREKQFRKTHVAGEGIYYLRKMKELRKGIYVPINSIAYAEYQEMEKGYRPHLAELWQKLNINFAAYNETIE